MDLLCGQRGEEIRILDDKTKENCRLIVEHYGVGHQLIQLAEECGELATASLHFRRGKIGKEQFTTEVADVMVMVQQLIQCGFIEEDDLYRLTLYKTERQLDRIRRGTE